MLATLDIDAFHEAFAYNPARRRLFDGLSTLVAVLRADYDAHSIVVFGSYLTDKTVPNDIDVLLSATGTADGASPLPHVLRARIPEGVHAELDQVDVGPYFKAPLSAAELMSRFNRSARNVNSGITMTDAIEVISGRPA